jgi:release factor glutamine methyltransferase
LANLPYLSPSQIKNSQSIKHEPKLALTAGADGLKYYRQLFEQITNLKKMLRVTCYVLCEIDPSQKNSMRKLINKELPSATLEIKKDLKGHSRLVIINL